MENKKNILFIIFDMAKGGAQRLASNLSLSLAEKFNIYFVLFEKKIDYPYSGELFVLNSKATKNYVLKSMRFLKRVRAIKKIKNEIRPDISVSFLDNSNIFNILANLWDTKILNMQIDHSTKHLRGFNKKAYNFFIKKYYNNANVITVPSEYIKYTMIKEFNIKPDIIKTIYNFVDIETINKQKEESLGSFENLFKYRKAIVNMGRLTYQKGQWHLLRAFAKVKELHPNISLIIMGEGDLKDDLIELSNSLNLKTYSVWGNKDLDKLHDVYFLGFQKNPFKILYNSRIFVLSSLWEGFPFVLLEALACGLPVISSDCFSGPREILAPATDILNKSNKIEMAEYGILIPEGDKKQKKYNDPLIKTEVSLIEAMKLLLEDENLYKRYKEQSLKRAKDFDKKEIMNKWLEIIESN